MQKPKKPEPVDLYFWRSDENRRVCLPWLWLGPSYRIPSADEEERLRNTIRKSYIYRFLSARIFMPVSVLSFTAIDIYHDIPNRYFIHYLGIMFLIYVVLNFILRLRTWYFLKSMEKDNFTITHRQYFCRSVELRGEIEYSFMIEMLSYLSIVFLLILFIVDEDFTDVIILFIVALQIWLVCTIRTMRIYFEDRPKTNAVDDHDYRIRSDVPESGD